MTPSDASLAARTRLFQLVVTLVAGAAALAALVAFTRPDAFVAAAHAADAAFDLQAYGTRPGPDAYRYEGVPHAWFVSALVLVQAAAAIGLAWRAPHRVESRPLALFLAALAVAEGHFAYPAQVVGLDGMFAHRATFVATLAAMAAFLRFAAVFPARLTRDDVLARPDARPVGRLRRRVWPALLDPRVTWGAAALLALPIMLSRTIGVGTTLLFAILLPWTVVQGVRMLRVGRRLAPPPLRRRGLWIVQGFVAGIALLFGILVLQVVALRGMTPQAAETVRALPLHNLVTPLFVAGLLMAVFYDGALDPALTIRRTAVYGVLGVGVMFLFSGIEGLVGGVLTRTLGLSDAGATWFAGGASALIVGTVRERAEQVGARWLGPWLPERTLAELPSDDAVVVVVDPCDVEGDPNPLVRLAALHSLARRLVPQHRGEIAMLVGDAVVLTFGSPADATAAIDALRERWPAADGVLRVGVQQGRVIRVPEGGMVGPALALADRARRQGA